MTATKGRGQLVALEGIDGAGKSTLARAIVRRLRARGYSVALRREPADPVLGRLAQAASVTDAWTGAVYFTLDRFLARPQLQRQLARHDFVISDRSFYSTLAYQGSALDIGERRRLAALQRTATITPDRVILVDLEPSEAVRRLGRRGGGRGPLERRRVLERVARAYRQLARAPRWRAVDGSQSPAALVDAALAAMPPRRRTRT
jgi:dTMP kinase